MTMPNHEAPVKDDAIALAAAELLREHQCSIWMRTDRLFAGMLVFQWLAAVLIAIARTPDSWRAENSGLHPHVHLAIWLGAAVISVPLGMVWFRSGTALTRHVIAVGQTLMSGILIHVGDGRIEMHFHVFGSLAFLAFYRDWKVLVTASAVIAADHFLRGMFLPLSVYGVMSASLWRTLEHAGWVVFEDVFLIGACVRGVREMRGIAEQRALIEASHREVERQVEERTRQLKDAQDDLLKTARTAGMAEIATSVLHNVGNVLNSVNVSATIVMDKLKHSEVGTLGQVSGLLAENKANMGEFMTKDERGQVLPEFLSELSTCLENENKGMREEMETLVTGIGHIKQVVAAQQSMSKRSHIATEADPVKVMETALQMQGASVARLDVRREFQAIGRVLIDEHKVMQILINLISNARQAVLNMKEGCVTLRVEKVESPEGLGVRFQVSDNGVGIAKENLARIFAHGFTTKSEGHGFGLHSAANAAREMGGSLTVQSEGKHHGATFTLEVPVSIERQERKAA